MSGILASLLSWFKGSQNDSSRDLVDQILKAHTTLVGLDDLQPGEITNETLGGLVGLCCGSHDSVTVKKVLNHRRIKAILPSLRRISSESECCLEAYWNSYIITRAGDPKEALQLLKSFPYFQNYVELSRLELYALYAVEPSLPRRIAFLGSGPLPLTSMCLLRSLRDSSSISEAAVETAAVADVEANGHAKGDDESDDEKRLPVVVNIDNNATALATSTVLCEQLGAWSEGMAFRCSDACSTMDLSGYDVVFLAALVGVSQREKEDIITDVARRMRPGALMVVRSALGLRTVLYPEVDLFSDRIREVLQVETVTHPHGKVVNSVIIARVKAASAPI
ncbi:putative Nicotianamine synthase [Seiridium cardinale]